jgi:guanyl-specific ribonuclease Sa
MSGFIHRDRIPTCSFLSLAPEVREAIINAKNRGVENLRQYGNEFGGPADGPPLPKVDAGCTYREADVGQAHEDDARGIRGQRRLVFEVESGGRIRNIYYTMEHYEKGSFVRVT